MAVQAGRESEYSASAFQNEVRINNRISSFDREWSALYSRDSLKAGSPVAAGVLWTDIEEKPT